jgi:exodeoxyribonuclease III
VRIATWNVNSVKQRVPRLLAWLDERQPDVVCLRETKLADKAFATLLDREGEARRAGMPPRRMARPRGTARRSFRGLGSTISCAAFPMGLAFRTTRPARSQQF